MKEYLISGRITRKAEVIVKARNEESAKNKAQDYRWDELLEYEVTDFEVDRVEENK